LAVGVGAAVGAGVEVGVGEGVGIGSSVITVGMESRVIGDVTIQGSISGYLSLFFASIT